MSEHTNFSKPIAELRAIIYYLSEKEGGRKTWIGNGYRGQFYYDGKDWDACQTFINREKCLPGESIDCYLSTLSPQYHIGNFYLGKEFEIREGAKVVGKGIITEILREDFNIKK